VTSPAAIDEFLAVVGRPAFRDLIEPTDAEQLAGLLRRVELFHPSHVPAVCRDPNDDYLLALAAAAAANVLVTRDEDLLVLRKHGETEIVHVAEFLRRIQR
jgi:putative PIN family toxin of toxin-antitoxin system